MHGFCTNAWCWRVKKAKKIDDDLFESCWMHVRNWMFLKRVPEFRFDADLKNVQEYMLGCCVALDKALERPDFPIPDRVDQMELSHEPPWRKKFFEEMDKDKE